MDFFAVNDVESERWQDLEARIRNVLLDSGGKMARRVLWPRVKNRRWDYADFQQALANLHQRQVVKIAADKSVELLDYRKPTKTPTFTPIGTIYGDIAIVPEPHQPEPAPLERRAATWDRTDGKCWYCGKEMNPFRDFQIDHVRPKSQGGTDDPENLVPCCTSCNFAKRARTLDQFRALYRDGHRFYFEKADQM